MITQIRIGLVILAAGILLIVALAVSSTEGAKDEFRFDAAKLKDGTQWIQVNTDPYYITPTVNALCAPAYARDSKSQKENNPHAGAYITVYVNKVGREAMFARDAQRFPEGSIIVKEKMSNNSKSRKPLLYTLMKKREPGYNPTVGDWEFSVVGPDGKQLQAIGKLENCQSCHEPKSDSDFVFRPYVKLQ